MTSVLTTVGLNVLTTDQKRIVNESPWYEVVSSNCVESWKSSGFRVFKSRPLKSLQDYVSTLQRKSNFKPGVNHWLLCREATALTTAKQKQQT